MAVKFKREKIGDVSHAEFSIDGWQFTAIGVAIIVALGTLIYFQVT